MVKLNKYQLLNSTKGLCFTFSKIVHKNPFPTFISGSVLSPMSEGGCTEFVLLWYFHRRSGECRPFVYGGCGGNQNRFPSRQECQKWCHE
uniref:BPTI/Kunitz inhibitor domain-containing protein n=1 Tax=Myripristis murdjan TaxID=586833 RepID=A0A668ATA4_9TELE